VLRQLPLLLLLLLPLLLLLLLRSMLCAFAQDLVLSHRLHNEVYEDIAAYIIASLQLVAELAIQLQKSCCFSDAKTHHIAATAGVFCCSVAALSHCIGSQI
jgi:hypothetical protein